MYLNLLGRKKKQKTGWQGKDSNKKKEKETNSEAGKVEFIAGNRQQIPGIFLSWQILFPQSLTKGLWCHLPLFHPMDPTVCCFLCCWSPWERCERAREDNSISPMLPWCNLGSWKKYLQGFSHRQQEDFKTGELNSQANIACHIPKQIDNSGWTETQGTARGSVLSKTLLAITPPHFKLKVCKSLHFIKLYQVLHLIPN